MDDCDILAYRHGRRYSILHMHSQLLKNTDNNLGLGLVSEVVVELGED